MPLYTLFTLHSHTQTRSIGVQPRPKDEQRSCHVWYPGIGLWIQLKSRCGIIIVFLACVSTSWLLRGKAGQ